MDKHEILKELEALNTKLAQLEQGLNTAKPGRIKQAQNRVMYFSILLNDLIHKVYLDVNQTNINED